MEKRWDVFISHAWEDKDTIVRELANALENLKVKIWYDEFTLKIGDSLSESIDNGLKKSRFAIVIFSKTFMEKHWAQYEYRSLLSKEEDGQKIILPIWHNISKSEIKDFSLYLSDKFALSTSDYSVGKLALELTKIVRPDIYRSLYGYLLFKKIIKEGETKVAKVIELKKQENPLSKLSKSLEVRARNIHYGIGQAFTMTIDDTIYNYELDLRPDREIQTWEIMNLCYLEYLNKYDITDMKTKIDIASLLLGFSIGQLIEVDLSADSQTELLEMWKKYYYEY